MQYYLRTGHAQRHGLYCTARLRVGKFFFSSFFCGPFYYVAHFLRFNASPAVVSSTNTHFLSFQSAMMVKEQVQDDPGPAPGRQNGYASGNNNNYNNNNNNNNLGISRHSSQRSMHTHEQELEHEQILGWGAMFGDVALVTNRNYFTTTTARGRKLCSILLFSLRCYRTCL